MLYYELLQQYNIHYNARKLFQRRGSGDTRLVSDANIRIITMVIIVNIIDIYRIIKITVICDNNSNIIICIVTVRKSLNLNNISVYVKCI